jgi:hypothetical protein
MELKEIFNRLWTDYSAQNPSVNAIYNLLKNEGEEVVNDHIAFRTLDAGTIDIDSVAVPFVENGYVPAGEYFFREKHLYAKHYEIPGNKLAPRIFISQLILRDCAPFIGKIFTNALNEVDMSKLDKEHLIFAGQIFSPISWELYERLRIESEYAAWFYVFGFRANHFTVSINALKKYNTIVKVNELLKSNGFVLNSSGGEIKGLPTDLLQQSSTMADLVKIKFKEGEYMIPSCYYEFAQRYPDANGELYSGFIARSADKIFESTNMYHGSGR